MISLIIKGLAVIKAVFTIIKLTFSALRKKLIEKFAMKIHSKVLLGDLNTMLNNCHNRSDMTELNQLAERGYTHIIAGIDKAGKVSGIEVTKDELNRSDELVYKLIYHSGKGMVVLNT